jgi:hypothetical protein
MAVMVAMMAVMAMMAATVVVGIVVIVIVIVTVGPGPSTHYACKFLLVQFHLIRHCCCLIFWLLSKKSVKIELKLHHGLFS